MKFKLVGFAVFAFLVATLFTARFEIVPTPMQYAFCVAWSAMLGWSVAVITKRMAVPQATTRKRQG